ncbi:head-tail joining protein [Sphingomonas hengshuiensis]|uniref:Uncharacterized protein n=1 Tax=Sphingomonas hengshuiensis TaxID=1609977 RepID=A0A7U4J8L2_9SPHN|nr:hypothetical protein [Sphingomonas hengshuiensis]AJP72270.1 hypothetical protein TS85_11440 [Sphingomonas hengshuiensis]
MSFPELRAALVDSVFAELGEDARWSGVADPVRVRRKSADEDETIGRLGIIATSEVLRVRKSDVAAPAKGDLVDMLDDAGVETGEQLRVSGEPRILRNLVWEMPFSVVAG